MPSSAVTRLNKITYKGFAVGLGTNYHLHGSILLVQDYTTLSLSFLVICHDPTEATFVTQCNALEAAFKNPNGDLKLEIGGSEAFDLSHANNTGMLAQPEIRKTGSSLDSNNTRLYSVSVTLQLPASESGKSGRQSSKVSYTSDGAEVIRLDVAAVYTALSSNGALAQAKSAFPGYVTTLQGVEGGTWDELIARTYQHDSDDKFCQASASYIQVISSQSTTATNDTTLQGVRISIATRTRAPGDAKGSGAKRLEEVTITFFTRVRRSVTTDLLNVWETKVRPQMIAVAADLSGSPQLVAIEEFPGLSPQDNTISARMVFLGGGGSLISSDIVTSEVETASFLFEPVLTGKPFDRDRHTIPGTKFAVVFARILETDTNSDSSLAGFRAAIRVFEAKGYHVMRKSVLLDRRIQSGLPSTRSLRIRAREVEALMEFAKIVGGKA